MISCSMIERSDSGGQANLDGTGAFAAFANLILDGLTFAQLLDGRALDLGVVEEHVVSVSFDESKSLVRHHLLDLTLWHVCTPEKKLNLLAEA